jgi:hypothetical protein
MSLLISHGLEFSNVSVRLDQFFTAVDDSLDNYLLGVGLGRNVYLESYLAAYTHRYGLVGFLIYNVFYVFLAVYSYSMYRKTSSIDKRVVYLFGMLWALNLPLLMLSNPMFEMGKNAIFSIFILSVLFGTEKMSSRTA